MVEMIHSITFWQKPVKNMCVTDATKLLQHACIDNKNVAFSLFSNGLNGRVTDKFVQDSYATLFTKKGELSKRGRTRMFSLLKVLSLPKNSTIQELYDKAKLSKFYIF